MELFANGVVDVVVFGIIIVAIVVGGIGEDVVVVIVVGGGEDVVVVIVVVGGEDMVVVVVESTEIVE